MRFAGRDDVSINVCWINKSFEVLSTDLAVVLVPGLGALKFNGGIQVNTQPLLRIDRWGGVVGADLPFRKYGSCRSPGSFGNLMDLEM
jgi:hypothetical protein